MSLVQTKKCKRSADELRKQYRVRAYEQECKTGIAPAFINEAITPADAIDLLSNVRGKEARAAAVEIAATPDSLGAFSQVISDISEPALNYLYSCTSYRYFSKKYMPHYFDKPFTPLYHDPYFELLRGVETHTITKPVVVAGPRHWGKTAMGSVMCPMHCIIFPVNIHLPNGQVKDISKKYIILLSVNEKSSQRNLGNVCGELEDNDAIRMDFGEFYKDPDASRHKSKPWSRSIAVTANGKRIEAMTRHSKVRGAFWKGGRPDLEVGDDLEDDEKQDSPRQRIRDFRWLTHTLAPTLRDDTGNLMLLGNLTHHDGLIARVVEHTQKTNTWITRVFKVSQLDSTGKRVFTWPECYGPKFEAERRATLTDEAYEQEYLMEPGSFDRELKKEDFGEYDMDDIENRLAKFSIYCAMDPAASVTKRSDNTACVPIAFDPLERITYVLPAFLDKVPVKGQADMVLDFQQMWDPLKFGIEAVAYQIALAERVKDLAESLGVEVPVVPIKQGSSTVKEQRIAMRLFRRIADKRILFLRGDPTHIKIRDELINLNNPVHPDDGCDCLEMAQRLCDEDILASRKRGRIRVRVMKMNQSRVTGLG